MSSSASTLPHFYFMGICGTAMGSVAAALADRGYRITGSDAAVYPPMSTFLEEKGISILDGYKAENLPDDVDVFVIGNAQSRGNPEVERVLNEKRHYLSLPEVIKEYELRGKRNFVVTGTHGKTTTTSLMSWLFESGQLEPGFMIGGIPRNFGQGARWNDSPFVILEGDEYDTAFFDKRSKFLHYLPELVVVNNIEFDHADIFDDLEQILKSFRHLLRLVPSEGLVCLNGDDPNCLGLEVECPAPVKRVGFGENCDARIEEVRYTPGRASFVLEGEAYDLPMDGAFNVRNAAMAICGARFAGLEAEVIREGLLAFKGIARRQEIRGVSAGGVTVVDDFGHHPTAIREAIEGLRHRFEGCRLWALFEPRSNTTRRKVFQEVLPEALGHADAVCISAVEHPEKVAADDRLDPERVVEELNRGGTLAFHESGADAIVQRLSEEAGEGDVVIVFSNGGFGGIHDKLLASL